MNQQAEQSMQRSSSGGRPMVSVILAMFNEAAHIEKCITSLLAQQTPDFDLEILAVDGMSEDGTREILETIVAADPRVRILVNKRRRTPFAFTLGLREARGEYVCIFGSHTTYREDYISVCLRELIDNDAVATVGRIVTRPLNDTLEALLVAWAVSHPFGSSGKSFRTQREGVSETVNYPVARKAAFLEAGGFSEQLLRNQDNDMIQKLRAKGYKLYCTWKTECYYHPKGTLKNLFVYAYRSGFWNVISFKKNLTCMGLRHFIPFFYLVALLLSFLFALCGLLLPRFDRELSLLPFFALLGLHLGAGTLAALQIAWRERSAEALCLPFVFLGFHAAYGLGTLFAFATGAGAPAPQPERMVEATE